MADFIDINELLKGDSAPIEKIIGAIERLNGEFTKLVETSQLVAKHYTDSLGDIQEATTKLEKSFASLDITSKKDQDQLSKSAGELEELTATNDHYNTSLSKTKEQITILLGEQKKLEESNEKLKKTNADQAGSLNDLRAQLGQAVKDYQAMGTATSQAVKDETLTKIKNLSKAVNESDAAIKQAKKGVDVAKGSYQELTQQVNKAKAELKAMEGGIGSNSAEFKRLSTFIKDGSDKLKEFDKTIGDNQRNVGDYGIAVSSLDNATGGLLGKIKLAGQAIKAAFSSGPLLIITALVGAFLALKNAADSYYKFSIEGEEELEARQLQDTAFLRVYEGLWSQLGGTVAGYWEQIKLAAKSTAFFFSSDEVKKQVKEQSKAAGELANTISELRLEHLEDMKDDAETERKVNEELEKSKDKLGRTDEERLEAIRKVRKLLSDQLEGDIELAKKDVTQAQLAIAAGTNTIKTREDLYKAETALIKVQSDASVKRRALLKQEAALVLEIENAKRQAAERAIDTQREVDKFLLEDKIETQKEILAKETSSLEDRVDALMTIEASRVSLLELEKQKELDVVQRAAEERIRAEGKVVTEELLALDEGLLNQKELIAAKYVDLVEDTNKQTTEAVKENFFKVLARDAAIATAEINEEINQQLTILNEAFSAGGKSIRDIKAYEEEKLRIQEEGQREALLSQLRYLREQVEATEEGTKGRAELLEKVSKVELELSAVTTAGVIRDIKKKEAEQAAVIQKIFELENAVAEFGLTLVAGAAQKRAEQLEADLAKQEEFRDKRLAIVQGDKQAEALIEQDFANKQAAIQAQIAQERRRVAIFEKAKAASDIIVNTARAAVQALPAIPLSILIGAIGALNLAKVLATPIPAYWTGTESSIEGVAKVGERGTELGVGPDGKLSLYDKGPEYTYLKGGTRIFNAEDTQRIAELMDIENNLQGQRRDALLLGGKPAGGGPSNRDVVEALARTGDKITEAIKSKEEYYDEAGYRRYERSRNGRIQRLDDKYRFSK